MHLRKTPQIRQRSLLTITLIFAQLKFANGSAMFRKRCLFLLSQPYQYHTISPKRFNNLVNRTGSSKYHFPYHATLRTIYVPRSLMHFGSKAPRQFLDGCLILNRSRWWINSQFLWNIIFTTNVNSKTQAEYPDTLELEQLYCDVVERRDLYWVQQLIVERQIPANSAVPPELRFVLGEVNMMIKKIEDSMVYIRRWAKLQGWKMDFDTIEACHRDLRPGNHPCRLLAPYIIEIPISGSLPPNWRPRGY